jgi:hypothetical protein
MIILILSSCSKRAFITADNRRRFTALFLELQLVFPFITGNKLKNYKKIASLRAWLAVKDVNFT